MTEPSIQQKITFLHQRVVIKLLNTAQQWDKNMFQTYITHTLIQRQPLFLSTIIIQWVINIEPNEYKPLINLNNNPRIKAMKR